MISNAFFFCGLLFSIYTFQKIFLNYEYFVMNYENEFGNTKNLNFFLSMLFISCMFAWPIIMVNEINNRQDLQ